MSCSIKIPITRAHRRPLRPAFTRRGQEHEGDTALGLPGPSNAERGDTRARSWRDGIAFRSLDSVGSHLVQLAARIFIRGGARLAPVPKWLGVASILRIVQMGAGAHRRRIL